MAGTFTASLVASPELSTGALSARSDEQHMVFGLSGRDVEWRETGEEKSTEKPAVSSSSKPSVRFESHSQIISAFITFKVIIMLKLLFVLTQIYVTIARCLHPVVC